MRPEINKKYVAILGVLLLSAITSFWMLPSMSLRSHECFVSVTAREMVQNNDYIWPTMNGEPRLQKTPLGYWLIAGVAKLTGDINELSARLPSALFAFLSAGAILYYLSRWMSLRIAVISTAVWATSLAYLRCSHRARPDMVMTFFIVLCMLSFYSIVISRNRRQQIIHSLVFWISFALGNLAKGPAPVAYVSIPIAVYLIYSRKWKIIPKMLPFVGSLIFLAIVLPWPLFIAQKLNWDLVLWKHEYFDRLFGSYASGGYPIYYYIPDMFKYITPWVAFLPIAVLTPFYKIWKEKRPLIIYMGIWVIANFIFLTLDAGKRQHYILPLIPPMSILIGIVLDDMIFCRQAYSSRFIKNVLKSHVIGLGLLALVSPAVTAFINPPYFTRVLWLSVITIISLIVIVGFFKRQKPRWATVSVFSSITVFIMLCYFSFSAITDVDAPARNFALKIADIVPDSEKLVAYEHPSSKFVQYYGNTVPGISDQSKLQNYYNQGYWIVCFLENVDDIKDDDFNVVYSSIKKPEDEGVVADVYFSEIVKGDSGGILYHKPVAEQKKRDD